MPSPRRLFGIDLQVYLLGIVSFLTDVSSEMIFAVFSVFVTVVLGASAVVLGLMEGLSDFAASSLDFVAGYLSDKAGKRKPFAVAGYSFSTAAKAFLLVATTVTHAFLFRVLERLGKSFRGPPRDALLAATAKKDVRGLAFGIHKALDRAGAIVGPLIAYVLLSALGDSAAAFRTLFLVAVIPALLAVLVISLFVKEQPFEPRRRFDKATFKTLLNPEYRQYLRAALVFSIGYFSFAFLLLKAYLVGYAIKDVALLYALFNLILTLAAIPVGRLSDRLGRRSVIAASYVIYTAMLLGMIFLDSKAGVLAMLLVYGIFLAIDESQTRAYLADLSAPDIRATAIGVYNFATGLVYLPASVIAGLLWSSAGPAYAFGFAALISSAGLLLFFIGRPSRAKLNNAAP
jgi:MFS family permease